MLQNHLYLHLLHPLWAEFMKFPSLIGSPLGDCVEVNQVCKSCTIDILHLKLECDLVVLDLLDYDVIFGIYLLKRFEGITNCARNFVTMTTSVGEKFSFYGNKSVPKPDSILDKTKIDCLSESKIESMPVVKDFLDVFLGDLSGLPPIRGIEFSIKTCPSASPISIPPYRMAPAELKELKKQL